MPTNSPDAHHTQWVNLTENINVIADEWGNPFFQKSVSRLERFWEERVTTQKDKTSAALLSALAQALTVYTTTESVTKAFVQSTTGGTPGLPKSVWFPRRGPL